MIPRNIVKDSNLSIEAKGIYLYLIFNLTSGEEIKPSVQEICSDLNISPNRFKRYRKELEDKGYITVNQKYGNKGFKKNDYTFHKI